MSDRWWRGNWGRQHALDDLGSNGRRTDRSLRCLKTVGYEDNDINFRSSGAAQIGTMCLAERVGFTRTAAAVLAPLGRPRWLPQSRACPSARADGSTPRHVGSQPTPRATNTNAPLRGRPVVCGGEGGIHSHRRGGARPIGAPAMAAAIAGVPIRTRGWVDPTSRGFSAHPSGHKHERPLAGASCCLWRRGWDSNPRTPVKM